MPSATGGGATQQHQQQQQQQRDSVRRPMIQGPYGFHPFPSPSSASQQQQLQQHQQQQQQAYLASSSNMGMNMGNLGMTMSNMESSMRSFAPLQNHQQQTHIVDSTPAPYWRPTPSMDSQQQQLQLQQQQQHQNQNQFKQPSASGAAALDLDLNDFLASGRDGSGGGGSSASGASTVAMGSHTSGDSRSIAGDVIMAETGNSFQLPSTFTSLASLSVSSSVAPLNMATASVTQAGARSVGGGGPSSSASTSPTSDASSSRSTPATSMARPAALVATTAAATAATTPGAGAGDYSRYVDSTDEPDLSQHKIEQKNEKCQFHSCPNRARVSQAYGKFCNRHVIVAPCGFPGCRDKALIHSSMCDKHLAEGKDALHRILANRAQNVPVCRTFGCFKNDQGRGYCRGHEKLLMATGRLPKHINKRRLNSAYTMCSFPNCNKHSQRNHLCRTHGNMVLKQAEDLVKQSSASENFDDILARLQKDIRRCTHPTCTKNSQRDRLCTMHYYEKYSMAREGGGASGKDADSQLSSTDGGGESDLETSVCTMAGCGLHAFSSKGLCKHHAAGQKTGKGKAKATTPSSTKQTDAPMQESDGVRTRPVCSISGCGNIAPYASGLCSHHGNKTNQAIQITRMNPHSPIVNPTSEPASCSVQACAAVAVPGSTVCGQHSMQRRQLSRSDVAAVRPSLTETSSFSSQGSQGSHSFISASSTDANAVFASGFDGFSNVSSGATGRMASLTVGGASSAESDARQALVNLNAVGKQPAGSFSNNECSNPMCTRESFGRDYCEACLSMFSPLVVSVGDGGMHATNNNNNSNTMANSNSFQFASLTTSNNQSPMQPEPEGDAMWDDAKAGSKSRNLCRVNECNMLVARSGLCDDHIRLFQAGSLSVDEIMLRSRQMREEKERAAIAAALASAEMKQATSPKIKKYFCKTDGCDKQAQKRGLCKRHFRMQEVMEMSDPQATVLSNFADPNQQLGTAQQHHGCRFPGCGETVNASTTLCPSHAKATFCWQAGCENLVETPQFCEYHSYRRECGFEGCSFPAIRDGSGCGNHAMELRCSHEHCEHYHNVGARSDRCRLHMDDCMQQPCALCEIYGLSDRPLYGSRASVGKSPMTYTYTNGGGGNDTNTFVNDRELTRQATVFGDGRGLM